jgi:hypothetical protein
VTGTQCAGGSYLLSLEGPGAVVKTLSKAPSVDNGIVGDPPELVARLATQKGSGK